MDCCEYNHWSHYHNTFAFLLFKYYQEARVLDYTRPEKPTSDKHSNLLGPFLTYEENKVS
jgi:hypothetical protein